MGLERLSVRWREALQWLGILSSSKKVCTQSINGSKDSKLLDLVELIRRSTTRASIIQGNTGEQ